MPFQPGNKYGKGRPSVGSSLADAVRRKWPPERILELADDLVASEDEKIRYGVMTFLADRGYGKAKETVEFKPELSDEEYREELAIIAREHIASLSEEERARMLIEAGSEPNSVSGSYPELGKLLVIEPR